MHQRLSFCRVVFFVIAVMALWRAGAFAAAKADTDLTIQVTPRVLMAGAPVRVLVRVPPEVQNRMLLVALDSASFSASSTRELNGTSSQRMHEFSWPAVPAGEYTIEVRVVAADGTDRAATRTLSVLNRDGTTP